MQARQITGMQHSFYGVWQGKEKGRDRTNNGWKKTWGGGWFSLLWKHLESYWLLPNLCLDRVKSSGESSGIYMFATQYLIGILIYCRRYLKICLIEKMLLQWLIPDELDHWFPSGNLLGN